VGLDVSGIIESVGEDVQDITVGDAVLGRVDFTEYTSAGAADYAVLNYWAKLPSGLDFVQAAALPMAAETAYRSLDNLGVTAGHSILIHGAGTMVGFAAVQMALLRGARVTATAGSTFADRLRAFGATVTHYGDGMVDRVLQIVGGSPDLVLDAAPPSGVLPDLVKIAGDPKHVLTITDFAAAKELGVRDSLSEDMTMRFDILGKFARLAAERKFELPVARVFPLEEWRSALELSKGQNPRGKVMLLVRTSA
jgi:NADPH:quinone reductase-like Zn-dependent oxidoreductase